MEQNQSQKMMMLVLNRWNNKTSLVTPEEEVFYLVAFLTSAVPFSRGKSSLEYIQRQNGRILEFCEGGEMGAKQYLAHYETGEEWEGHFGKKRWQVMRRRKSEYDPLAILGPGHRIFEKPILASF